MLKILNKFFNRDISNIIFYYSIESIPRDALDFIKLYGEFIDLTEKCQQIAYEKNDFKYVDYVLDIIRDDFRNLLITEIKYYYLIYSLIEFSTVKNTIDFYKKKNMFGYFNRI
jgi:hypothetical protein